MNAPAAPHPDRPPAYNDPNLATMKQDIADRAFRIKMTGMLISGALFALGIGAFFLFPGALGVAAPLVGALSLAGGAISTLVTMKEAKKLQIDEEYLQSYMQGKNYWGKGYREEVAEHGYGGPHIPLAQGPTPPSRGSVPPR